MPYKDIEKQKAAQRAYYERNKSKVKATARDRRSYVRRCIEEYKQGKPCMDCGIEYPYWILQFDHRPGEVKVANVTDIVYWKSLDAVMEEIAKCDLVCANCHADRTHDRRTKNQARTVVELLEVSHSGRVHSLGKAESPGMGTESSNLSTSAECVGVLT